MQDGATPPAKRGRKGRRTLLWALCASVLFHLGVLLLLRAVPPEPRRVQVPVQFTLVERPLRQRPKPSLPPRAPPATPGPSSTGPGNPAAVGKGHPGERPWALPGSPPAPDTPYLQNATPGPSLEAMSSRAAEAVVTRRGPQHAPGDSAAERLTESLQRGKGAMAVEHNGYWDAYFGTLRKALLLALSIEHVRIVGGSTITARIRLVIDGEGLLRDFEIVQRSGSPSLDVQVERALHQMPQFAPPPEQVLHGKAELVCEWEFTLNPDLALAQGRGAPTGVGVVFDVVTLVNPAVDLTPLERNVTLASYWTR